MKNELSNASKVLNRTYKELKVRKYIRVQYKLLVLCSILVVSYGYTLEEDVELCFTLALELHLLLEHLLHPVRIGARALTPRRRLRDLVSLARRDSLQERAVLRLCRT